ncbi:MAG: hypothetical protein IPP15_10215 [Saprospiraceae bacterium]|uniref:Uncharacterized protein n=1 Tax=Candidatus Opimibacter skivensis TaxID=2982028 RepID=A0A9D7XQ82_9BACT|nr:hypothetical protein [Candidatus Opimibacter skivensis]
MYHFANLQKTRITVVADDKSQIEGKIKSLYPFLDKTVDIRYEYTRDFSVIPVLFPLDDISLCFAALDEDGKSVYSSRNSVSNCLSREVQQKKKHPFL